ncbi:MAG: hypothetical protein HYX24_01435 [Candidatus Aenigmarchaeota archaeon]|nr:hypothetical protein [Candidatus Aenigmarchaeota archaeon]
MHQPEQLYSEGGTLIYDIDGTIYEDWPERRLAIELALGRKLNVKIGESLHDFVKVPESMTQEQFRQHLQHLDSGKLMMSNTPKENAAEVIKKWSGKYKTVYLTSRLAVSPDGYRTDHKLLEIFERDGFPLPDGNGVTLFMRLDKAQSPTDFKREQIRSTIIPHMSPLGGIGDRIQDARVYGEFGIYPIIFNKPRFQGKKMPEKTILVRDWKEVDDAISYLTKQG